MRDDDDDNFLISKWELTIPKVTKQPNYLISYIATEASIFLILQDCKDTYLKNYIDHANLNHYHHFDTEIFIPCIIFEYVMVYHTT